MELNEDEVVKILVNNLVLTAYVKMLTGSFLGYVSSVDKTKGDALKKFFDDNFQGFLQQEIESSPLKHEFLEYFSQDALQQIKDQLGL